MTKRVTKTPPREISEVNKAKITEATKALVQVIKTPRDALATLVAVAGLQITAAPGGLLGWVVRFIRETPAEWLPGDVEAHGYRLLALVIGTMPASAERLLTELGMEDLRPVAPADVDAIHGDLRRFLLELVTAPAGTRVPVPTDGLKEALVRLSAPGEKPACFGLSRGGLRRTLVFQAVTSLILSHAPLIACPTCHEPFLALRKMRFCSTRCRQNWHDARRPSRRKGER